MNKRIFLLFLGAWLSACVLLGQQRGIPLDGYAAIVNDRIITVGDIVAYLQSMEDQFREDPSRIDAAAIKARESLVERALILEYFETLEKAHIPDTLIEDHIKGIIHDKFNNDKAEFLQALEKDRLSLEEFKERTRDNLAVMMLRKQEVLSKIYVAPQAVRELYESNLEDYRKPERIKLRMIAVHKGETPADQTVKRSAVEDLLAKLNNGADFGSLAANHSEGGKAANGGDWGWVEPTQFRKELADVIARLSTGQISEIVDLGRTYYILFIEGRQKASTVPLEMVQTELEDTLRQREMERLNQLWINRLKERFYIKLYDIPELH